jgi:hypothetical protein
MIDTQQTNKITKIVEQILVNLTESNHIVFAKKPTVYIYPVRNRFLISLVDENKNDIELVELKITDKPKKGALNFFVSSYFDEDWLFPFARDKVASYLEEARENKAYSINLKRSRSLNESGHYLASLVFLISAFETAMKDIFFRSNDLWFVWPAFFPEAIYDKYGERLPINHLQDGQYEHYTWTSEKSWGFSGEGNECVKKWHNIQNGSFVFQVCGQLGILEEYLLKLYSNKLEEIRSYDILKHTLESKGARSAINFQIIDGTGGIKWAFKKFMNLDFTPVDKDLTVIKEAAEKRHKIIHGFLDEKEISADYVKDVETAVIKVVEYVKNDVLEWSYMFNNY